VYQPLGPAHLALCAFCLLALSGCQRQKVQSAGAPPPVPVSVAKAAARSVPVEVRVVGTAEASEIVQVKSQVGGQLLRVLFTEGQNIAQDALMFEIDPRPYQEALRQAEANVTRDRAQLKQAEATLARDLAQVRNAETEAARNLQMVKEGIVSRSQYDQVRTSADVYQASVQASRAAIETTRAAIESDLAAVDKAKLDLGYCQIRAPLAGRAGNLLVHAGNLVKANDIALVVLHKVAPIFAVFSVPEQYLGEIRKLNGQQSLTVRVSPKGEPGRTAQGRVTVVDNTVDSSTGTIRLKAVLENREALLWPGQFVDVVLTLQTIDNATVVPAEAVQESQQGQFVYAVKPDGSVETRVVSAGRAHDGAIIIEKGVSPGETVVTDGHLRLYPGARIQAVDPRTFAPEKP
jgi:membrane fusion protein, multidrug efflux system